MGNPAVKDYAFLNGMRLRVTVGQYQRPLFPN